MNSKSEGKKKIIFVASLIIVTIFLAVEFGRYPSDVKEFINKGGKNIVEFYTKTLRPLFYSTQINKEEVFDFAQTGELPLNKSKNKFISVKSDVSGKSIFELLFKKSKPVNNSRYNKFVKDLKLKDDQQAKLDSILFSYRNKIYENVYLNKRNSVAVNSNLNRLRAALNYDLESFKASVEKKPDKSLFWALKKNLTPGQLVSIRRNLLNKMGENFILISPDTTLTLKSNGTTVKIFAPDSLQNNIANITQRIIKKWTPVNFNGRNFSIPRISVKKDSARVIVEIGGGKRNEEEKLVNLFTMNVNKDGGNEKVRINFSADTASGNISLTVKKELPDSTVNVKINFNPAALSGLIAPFLSNLDSLSEFEQLDSAFRMFEDDTDFFDESNNKSMRKFIKQMIKKEIVKKKAELKRKSK